MELAVYASPQPAINVFALTTWLALRGEVPGPLFLQADGGGTIRPDRGRLAGQAVARIVKASAAMLPAPCPVRLRQAPPGWTGVARRCLVNIVSDVRCGGRSLPPAHASEGLLQPLQTCRRNSYRVRHRRPPADRDWRRRSVPEASYSTFFVFNV